MRIALIALFVVFTCSFAYAQKDTGAIEGTVEDNEGRPVPGVTITGSSPSLIGGTRTTYTDPSGYYRFSVLAPGIYEVKAELNGFQPVSQKNITLSVATTLTVDFTLQIIQTSELIEVSGERPPLIDTTTTAVASVVPPEIVSNLPRSQDIQSLLTLTPGVSSDLVAYGAPADENSYWVDGVNMSNPRVVRGWTVDPNRQKDTALLLKYDQNWIDQVQVTGIGAPAEYGGFTGVVANFVTKSGGNQFHGLFETFFQNQDMVGNNWPDPPDKIPFKTFDISAQLGGPILKDKLWFFVGYQYPQTQTHPPDNLYLDTVRDPKMLSKVTYKHDDNNTLQGFVQFNHETDIASYFSHPEVSTLSKHPQWSWNAAWISILKPSTTLEARLGGFRDHFYSVEDRPDVPGHITLPEGKPINNTNRSDNTVHRLQTTVSLSHHADHFLLGGHDFRFGVEVERSDAVDKEYYNGGMLYYDFAYYGYDASRTIWAGRNLPTTTNSISAYAQDEWKITDRISASIGARWDHNRMGTDVGVFHSNDPVAPRLGVIWNLDRENQTVIKAHYGLYYEALLTGGESGISNGNSPSHYEYLVDGKWVDAGTSTPLLPNVPSQLKQPFMHQFDVGVDRVLPWNIPVGVHYIGRRWENIIGSIDLRDWEPVTITNPLDGQPLTFYRPTGPYLGGLQMNLPGAFRRYDSVELYGNKYFPHHFSLMGSLVYSNTRGSYAYVGEPDFLLGKQGIRDAASQRLRVKFDRPFIWKVSGTAPLPWGFSTGWLFHHESGGTWNAMAYTSYGPDVFLDPPGVRRRLPSRNLIDLRFEKQFPIYRGQAGFTIDVFNLLNSDAPIRVFEFVQDSRFGTPSIRVDPRQYRLGVRYTF